MVLREGKSKRKNLAMGWIDYKKAYDMIPHSWILECLELFGAAQYVKTLLEKFHKWLANDTCIKGRKSLKFLHQKEPSRVITYPPSSLWSP